MDDVVCDSPKSLNLGLSQPRLFESLRMCCALSWSFWHVSQPLYSITSGSEGGHVSHDALRHCHINRAPQPPTVTGSSFGGLFMSAVYIAMRCTCTHQLEPSHTPYSVSFCLFSPAHGLHATSTRHRARPRHKPFFPPQFLLTSALALLIKRNDRRKLLYCERIIFSPAITASSSLILLPFSRLSGNDDHRNHRRRHQYVSHIQYPILTLSHFSINFPYYCIFPVRSAR